MQVKLRFWVSPGDPLHERAECTEIAVLGVLGRPTAEIVRVECADCR